MNIQFVKIVYFFSGVLSSGLILNFIFPRFKKYMLDKPNKRSLHNIPVPTAGGVAFVLPIISFNIFQILIGIQNPLTLITSYCIPLAIVSFIDDFINVSSVYRYLIQLICSLLVISQLNLNFPDFKIGLILFLLILLMTSLINFTNFMDGSDGLVGSNMIAFFIILLIEGSANLNIYLLIGSLIPFIYWNWSPAKIFMGDIGSTFLGIYFLSNLLAFDSLENIFRVLFATFPLYGDAFFTLLKRLISKQNIFSAHRLHLYQRLFLGGLSKSSIAITYLIMSISIALVGYTFGIYAEILSVLICGIFMLMLDKFYAIPFDSEKG